MTIERNAVQEHRRLHSPLYNDQKLKLGLFGPNLDHGLTLTEAETTYRPTWDHTVKIAQRAEELGFEMLIPVARWRGFGGKLNVHGESLESYAWAAGLAALTEKIMVIATSHVPMVHPIVAAKQAATIDQISSGRFGLNMVMGWFRPEMEMFGMNQLDHDGRYRYGAEWIDVVRKLWTENEPFDFDGEYFHVKGGEAAPKPVQRPHPVLINAGNSPAGIDFSAREVDFNFATISSLEDGKRYAKLVRDTAREKYQRDIGVMTYGLVICRDTEKEALKVRDHILDKGDFQGARNIMSVLGMESESFITEQSRMYQESFVAGYAGWPIVGNPEQVTEKLVELSAIGIDGIAMGFLDYHEEMAHFGEAVMPLLKQAGLRS
jgi:FMNH2-dependent dimethyl sulfone monooxygenase